MPTFFPSFMRTRIAQKRKHLREAQGFRQVLNSSRQFIRVRRFSGRESETFKFPIERRAPDFQPTRHLGHLLVVVRDSEADNFGLDVLKFPHFTIVEQWNPSPRE